MISEATKSLKSLGKLLGFKVYERGGETFLRSRFQWYKLVGTTWMPAGVKDLPKDLFEQEKRRHGVA
jgi:hypothetical protein